MVQVTSVTVGLPVSDLATAREWYEAALGLDGPDIEPAEGVVEYQLGPVWLQLGEGEQVGAGGAVLRLGVSDVHAERARMVAMGVDVQEVVVIEGVVSFCDLRDPDGNELSIYTVASPG